MENNINEVENGFVTKKYFKDYKLHRETKDEKGDALPAWIQYYANGNKRIEKWYLNGVLSRPQGEDDNKDDDEYQIEIAENMLPTVIHYYENGNPQTKIWFRNGKRHRIFYPAVIGFYDSGEIRSECWFENGNIVTNSEDDFPINPGCIIYYKNGDIKEERWFINNKLDRENGLPSVIGYYKNTKFGGVTRLFNYKYDDITGKKYERWYQKAKPIFEISYDKKGNTSFKSFIEKSEYRS